ncbi:uncharacterized protein LOC62_06G007838 [Vanrija pseudolonga]|uniref:Uncharacterized protein n=1 Tax=Vanrija pseudolonga TaxID=143232 RepID=A0AAF0YFZ1_9TREE|nr:hypothetical protein LOC62_06G007838 [Vanrija pseudolonga]
MALFGTYIIVFFRRNLAPNPAPSDMPQPGLLNEVETPTIATPLPPPPSAHVAGTPEPYPSSLATHQVYPSNLATLQPHATNAATPPETLPQLHQSNAGGIPMLYTADGVPVAQFIPQLSGGSASPFAPPFPTRNMFHGMEPSAGVLPPGAGVPHSQFIPRPPVGTLNPFAQRIQSQTSETSFGGRQAATDDSTPAAYHSGKGVDSVAGMV